MKMLVHRTQVGTSPAFDLTSLKGYLRVDHDEEDAQIHAMGEAAARELEDFAQIALITQTIRVTIFNPTPGDTGLRLPIGPTPDDTPITVTIDGEPFTGFDFSGGNKPYIRWLATWYDLCPSRLNIEYNAGFGDSAADIPPDLAQALLDQATMFFSSRGPVDVKGHTTSPHMARIGARYRGVRA